MKKITYLLLLFLLCIQHSISQVSYYTFTQVNGTYDEFSDGTVLATATGATWANSFDNVIWTLPANAIPFNFVYNGMPYTTCKVSSNGFITFGTTDPSTASYTPISASTGYEGAVSAWGRDLNGAFHASVVSNVSWKIVGTAPNRELVIQYKNVRPVASQSTTDIYAINFQIRLQETTNIVKIVYGNKALVAGSATSNNSNTIQVGLRGVNNTDFLNRTNATTVAFSSSTAGTTNSATQAFNVDAASTTPSSPANGLTYVFTPPPPCNGMPTAGAIAPLEQKICVGSTPAVIVASGFTTGASNVGFQWEESDDNGVADGWTNVSGGTGALTTSYTPATFTTTKYYRLKVTCSTTSQTAYSNVTLVTGQQAPVTQASEIVFSDFTATSMRINWTNGSGVRRFVVVNSVNNFTNPVNGSGPALTAAAAYSGSGAQIVYDGTGTNVVVTGLTCNTTYYVRVYEYNRCGSSNPYTYFYNVDEATLNPTSRVSGFNLVTLPQTVNFTGFTGANLSTVFPNWFEAAGATPAGLTSSWESSSVLGVPTAKVNLYNTAHKEWIISQKLTVNAASRIVFKAAITNYNNGSVDPDKMAGTDDKVEVKISTDGCGTTWTTLYTFDSSNTTNLTNVLTEYSIDIPNTYIGQNTMIGFFGTDGTVDDTNDYDFHLTDVVVENIPDCDGPSGVNVTDVTKSGAKINWEASATNNILGYYYEIRTSGDAGSGATGLVTSGTTTNVLTYDITSLLPSTEYTVYVRTKCDVANFSAWSPGIVFETLCDYPELVSTVPGTICGLGTTTISADFSNNSNVKWYENQTGGSAIFTGTSFTTPELNATKSYWVSAVGDSSSLSGGKTSYGTSGTTPSTYGLVFNANQEFVLNSVDVYLSSTTAGNLVIRLTNNAGVTIQEQTIAVPQGGSQAEPVLHTIPLNLTIPEGTGYRLLAISGPSMIRDTSGNAYPYTIGDVASITSGYISGTSSSYYYFYNWQITAGCNSPRLEVPVVVTEAPELTLSVNEVDICQGNNSELLAIIEGADEYDTFVWTPSEGVSGDAVNGWIINSQDSDIYTLRASQSEGECAIDFPVQVNVTQVGYEPLEEEYIVCKDVIQELSVGADEIDINDLSALQLYSFSFDQVPLQGFTHNNLTGTTSVALSTSVFTEGTGSVRFSHVTNSTGNLTQDTALDVSGGYGVKIEFDHIALLESSSYDWDYGFLQYSLDGGSTWTSFSQNHYLGNADTSTTTPINYVRFGKNSYSEWNGLTSSTTPTNTMWKHETFFLQQENLDLTNFKIRFSLKSDGSTNWNGWYLDNLKINKISLPATVWTGEGLYVDSAATQPYAGENTQTVYFKQTQSGEYNVSATISNAVTNCSATTATTVKVPLVVLPVMENQVYCEPKAVEDLMFDRIDGYVYSWYASATSAATISTINTSGTYYLQATSNEGDCKSNRLAVEIIIAQNLNPTVNASYTFCDQATFANIQVGTQYGAAVQWFASTDSTTVLPVDTQLTTTTYYVALAINDCISERKPVSVTILQTPAPIAQQAFTVCFNTPLSQLSLGATNVKWYFNQTSTTALGVSAVAQNNTYYVTTFNGICESARIPVVVNVVQQLQMPTAATQNFCGSGTVSQLTATGAVSGAEYVWYNSATSTTPLQSTAALQNGTYYVSQKLTNCESPRRPVTVKVTNLTAPTATSFEFCGSATVADLSMPVISGITYNWYLPNQTTPLAGTANLVTGNYLVSKAQNGCESTKTIVQVTIKPRPASPTGSLTQNFMDSGMISDLVMDQSNVIWYVTYEDALSGNNPLQTNMPIEDGHIYYGVVIGSNGCPSLPTAVTATITLGVKDLDLASLKYYPNPVDSELTISYKEQIKLIEIYDLLGKQIKVQKFDSNDIRVNVSGLSSGTYMFRVQTNSGSQFIKIIKK